MKYKLNDSGNNIIVTDGESEMAPCSDLNFICDKLNRLEEIEDKIKRGELVEIPKPSLDHPLQNDLIYVKHYELKELIDEFWNEEVALKYWENLKSFGLIKN